MSRKGSLMMILERSGCCSRTRGGTVLQRSCADDVEDERKERKRRRVQKK